MCILVGGAAQSGQYLFFFLNLLTKRVNAKPCVHSKLFFTGTPGRAHECVQYSRIIWKFWAGHQSLFALNHHYSLLAMQACMCIDATKGGGCMRGTTWGGNFVYKLKLATIHQTFKHHHPHIPLHASDPFVCIRACTWSLLVPLSSRPPRRHASAAKPLLYTTPLRTSRSSPPQARPAARMSRSGVGEMRMCMPVRAATPHEALRGAAHARATRVRGRTTISCRSFSLRARARACTHAARLLAAAHTSAPRGVRECARRRPPVGLSVRGRTRGDGDVADGAVHNLYMRGSLTHAAAAAVVVALCTRRARGLTSGAVNGKRLTGGR